MGEPTDGRAAPGAWTAYAASAPASRPTHENAILGHAPVLCARARDQGRRHV